MLLALRRGEYGEAIHSLLGPLPAGILSQVAYGAVFAIATSDLSNETLGARAATITTLLMLGVPETRAIALVRNQP